MENNLQVGDKVIYADHQGVVEHLRRHRNWTLAGAIPLRRLEVENGSKCGTGLANPFVTEPVSNAVSVIHVYAHTAAAKASCTICVYETAGGTPMRELSTWPVGPLEALFAKLLYPHLRPAWI
jgi:hypothetical protein